MVTGRGAGIRRVSWLLALGLSVLGTGGRADPGDPAVLDPRWLGEELHSGFRLSDRPAWRTPRVLAPAREPREAAAAVGLLRIRRALATWAGTRGALRGTSLEPLVDAGLLAGRALTDPWGRAWLYDGSLGVVASYGADGQYSPDAPDGDRALALGPRLGLARVQYVGSWGRPGPGNAFVLQLAGACEEAAPADLPAQLDLLTNPERNMAAARALDLEGSPVSLASERAWAPGAWRSAGLSPGAGASWLRDAERRRLPAHDPSRGVLVVTFASEGREGSGASVLEGMGLDFSPAITRPEAALVARYQAHAEPPSPAEPAVFGWKALEDLRRPLVPAPRLGGCRVGVRLERY